MKKTLITLLALAGAAVGADYTVENIWSVDFDADYKYQEQGKNNDGTPKVDENGQPVMETKGGWLTTGTLTKPGTFWDVTKLAVDGGIQTKSDGRVHMAGGSYGNWTDDFAFSITFSMDSITAGHIAEIKDDGGAWMHITINDDGNLSMNNNTDGDLSNISSIVSTVVKTDTVYTLTLTKIGNAMTLYLDDTKAATATFTAAAAEAGVIDNITLGGNTGGGNRVPMFISNISWGKAASIPEPATATLSLLALAGLCARRRRG